MSRARITACQQGVALVAVLWIVAALAIAVTGMVQAQRDELRVAAAGRRLVEAQALGGAAMQLVLQRLSATTAPLGRAQTFHVAFAGREIAVEAAPLNGWINPNRAPEPLLAALFAVAGGVEPRRAGQLAQAVVAARPPTAGGGMEAPEDLLRVPGVDYELYARLAPLLTLDVGGSGRVNPLAAPMDVLRVLARGDAGVAGAIIAGRERPGTEADTTRLDPAFIDASVSPLLRLQARVPLPDGRVVRLTRDVEFVRNAMPGGAPWRFLNSQETIEPPARPSH